MAFPIVMSRNKLSMFNTAAQVRAGRGSFGSFGALGYEPQSQSLLEDDDEGYRPSASLLDHDPEPYSQSLVDERAGFQVDSSLERELSINPYGGGSSYTGSGYGSSSRISRTTAANYPSSEGSFFVDDIGSAFASILKGFTGGSSTGASAPRRPPPPKPSNAIWWALGGVALVGGVGLLVAVTRKK